MEPHPPGGGQTSSRRCSVVRSVARSVIRSVTWSVPPGTTGARAKPVSTVQDRLPGSAEKTSRQKNCRGKGIRRTHGPTPCRPRGVGGRPSDEREPRHGLGGHHASVGHERGGRGGSRPCGAISPPSPGAPQCRSRRRKTDLRHWPSGPSTRCTSSSVCPSMPLRSLTATPDVQAPLGNRASTALRHIRHNVLSHDQHPFGLPNRMTKGAATRVGQRWA